MYNQYLGKKGEEIAENYLKKRGYKILEKNFECRQGEIDIIALDKSEIVFVEVKTRTSFKYGLPIEAINLNKQKHIKNATEYYIYKNNLQDDFIRFDAIEVLFLKEKIIINHIKQVL